MRSPAPPSTTKASTNWGDALKFADPDNPGRGLLFDGRIAEDFKLSTGTWTSVGPLRARFIDYCAPLVRDVVFAGPDLDDIVALVFPISRPAANLPGSARMPRRTRSSATTGCARSLPRCSRAWRRRAPARRRASSARLLMAEPPSMDKGEMTDKGSINQRAVLKNRARRW